jgi:hypothetical protein
MVKREVWGRGMTVSGEIKDLVKGNGHASLAGVETLH